ncbi:MAG: thioredoxin family protein [Paracoccaceae bacterium]
MQRRFFCLSFAACAVPSVASSYPSVPYVRETWEDLQSRSDKIVLNWRATWSLTCQRKSEILGQLVVENPSYTAITFVDVDWDTFGPSVWAERLKIKRRSTLVAMRNKREITRIENKPDIVSVRRFLDAVLDA